MIFITMMIVMSVYYIARLFMIDCHCVFIFGHDVMSNHNVRYNKLLPDVMSFMVEHGVTIHLNIQLISIQIVLDVVMNIILWN